MKKPHLPAIRELLRASRDGMTVDQLMRCLPQISTPSVLRKCLDRMPDAYIDRWLLEPGKRGQFQAVWTVVTPPPHCPYPTARFDNTTKAVATRWVTTWGQA